MEPEMGSNLVAIYLRAPLERSVMAVNDNSGRVQPRATNDGDPTGANNYQIPETCGWM